MNTLTNAIVVSVVPLMLAGMATIVVNMFEIKACMARIEERAKGHVLLHEALARRDQ